MKKALHVALPVLFSVLLFGAAAPLAFAQEAPTITSFTIDGQAGDTIIDNGNLTITVNMPFGTGVIALTPTIATSDDATVDPASGVSQDFSNPVTYTVTDTNGSTAYAVTVNAFADLSALYTEIQYAENVANAASVGNEVGQYPQLAYYALAGQGPIGTGWVGGAIYAALIVYGNGISSGEWTSMSQAAIDATVVTLQNAVTSFQESINGSPTGALQAINRGSEVYDDFSIAGVVNATLANQAVYDSAITAARLALSPARDLTLPEIQVIVDATNDSVTLAAAVALASSLNPTDFTPNSWTTLITAMVLPQGTNDEVVAKTIAINDAVSVLVWFVRDPILSLDTIVNEDGTFSGTTEKNIEALTDSSGFVTILDIRANTVLTSPSTWDGTLNMPVITTSPDVGTTAVSVEVGFGDTYLTLDKAGKLTFAGQAGNSVGYSHGDSDTFHEITAVCADNTQATNDELTPGADCKIDVGNDLVVWTKHFSTFTVLFPDTTPPTATVAYDVTTPTNGSVVATITPNEAVTGALTHTFTDNGTFTFTFTDLAGNAGSVDATVSNIDKVAPVITIDPYTLTPTNQDVIVNASANEGTLNATSYTFSANGSFDFVATDAAGNVTTQTVAVDNIDKVAPTAIVSYSTTDPTNTDVVATITPSEAVTGTLTHTFTDNGIFTFTFTDLAGNAGSVVATVSNINKAPPAPITPTTLDQCKNNGWKIFTNPYFKNQSQCISYVKANEKPIITIAPYLLTPTNQDITVNASTDEGTLNATSHTFIKNGSFTFVATNADAGTVTRLKVTITNIDKVAPRITVAPYTRTPTNQDVIVNAATNEGTLNAISHTFTANGSFTFVATDAAGNVTTRTVTITKIDKIAPVITIAPYNLAPTNTKITVKASTNEGKLNATSHIFTANGSFTFVATDAAGNVTEQTVIITNINK